MNTLTFTEDEKQELVYALNERMNRIETGNPVLNRRDALRVLRAAIETSDLPRIKEAFKNVKELLPADEAYLAKLSAIITKLEAGMR